MHLTERETAVLALIAHGLNDRAIAGSLGIQPGTARKHRENIQQKLGAGKAARLVWHYFNFYPDELKKSSWILCHIHSRRANCKYSNCLQPAAATNRSRVTLASVI